MPGKLNREYLLTLTLMIVISSLKLFGFKLNHWNLFKTLKHINHFCLLLYELKNYTLPIIHNEHIHAKIDWSTVKKTLKSFLNYPTIFVNTTS